MRPIIPGVETKDFDPEIQSSLQAWHMAPFSWRKVFTEIFDNSLDWHATRITASLKNKQLTVLDDGVGCEELNDMLRAGNVHERKEKKRIGRYGVGLKDAALWLWGELQIVSHHQGAIRSTRVTWDKLKEYKCAVVTELATPTLCDAYGLPRTSGTKLVFNHIARPGNGLDLARYVDDLSYIYSPAIESGKQISLQFGSSKPKTVPLWKPPILSEPLEAVRHIGQRRYRIRAGIVSPDQANEHSGFTIAYLYHVIRDGAKDPCGRFGADHFFAWVDLLDGDDKPSCWTLGRHKDEVIEYDELVADLAVLCEPLLRKAASVAEVIEIRDLSQELSYAVQTASLSASPDTKEKRLPGELEGTVEPVGTNRQRQNIRLAQPGERPHRVRSSNIPLRLGYPNKGPKGKLFDMTFATTEGAADVVEFNSDLKYIQELRKNRDAVIALALAIYAQRLPEGWERFKKRKQDTFKDMIIVPSDLVVERLTQWTKRIQQVRAIAESA